MLSEQKSRSGWEYLVLRAAWIAWHYSEPKIYTWLSKYASDDRIGDFLILILILIRLKLNDPAGSRSWNPDPDHHCRLLLGHVQSINLLFNCCRLKSKEMLASVCRSQEVDLKSWTQNNPGDLNPIYCAYSFLIKAQCSDRPDDDYAPKFYEII